MLGLKLIHVRKTGYGIIFGVSVMLAFGTRDFYRQHLGLFSKHKSHDDIVSLNNPKYYAWICHYIYNQQWGKANQNNEFI